jgi:hypothetical protein
MGSFLLRYSRGMKGRTIFIIATIALVLVELYFDITGLQEGNDHTQELEHRPTPVRSVLRQAIEHIIVGSR